MFDALKNLLRGKPKDAPRQPEDILRRSGAYRPNSRPVAKPAVVRREQNAVAAGAVPSSTVSGGLKGQIEDRGPGKNVLIRNPSNRKDAATRDELSLLDDSMTPSIEEAGIDPYNTGKFDRSKNWDKRFRER